MTADEDRAFLTFSPVLPRSDVDEDSGGSNHEEYDDVDNDDDDDDSKVS